MNTTRLAHSLFVAAILLGGVETAFGFNPVVRINEEYARDGTVTVHNTDGAGNKTSVAYKRDFLARERVRTTIEGTQNDLFPEITYKTSTALTQTTGGDIGALIPDPTNPGQLIFPPIAGALAAAAGFNNEVVIPIVANEGFAIYIGIDLAAYFNSGLGAPSLETLLTITDGVSSDLPGFQIGLSPIEFDPLLGFVNAAPFTGDVFVFGNFGITAIPEPSTLLLAAIGAAGLFGSLKRRERKINRNYSAPLPSPARGRGVGGEGDREGKTLIC